jgi:hypothetical protein
MDYFYYNGSVTRAQFDVEMLHVVRRYFDFVFLSKFSVKKSLLIYKNVKNPRGGLGGPPMFVACQSISVVVIELWAVEAFCLTPVIA